ncbi:hypothetical protein BJV82DRAFT_591476 [Fennellomyces sp. T-0311]|nr:hypothetical protein BJV82DRAFT_591476 [Fennellomyces sp. T-0311]
MERNHELCFSDPKVRWVTHHAKRHPFILYLSSTEIKGVTKKRTHTRNVWLYNLTLNVTTFGSLATPLGNHVKIATIGTLHIRKVCPLQRALFAHLINQTKVPLKQRGAIILSCPFGLIMNFVIHKSVYLNERFNECIRGWTWKKVVCVGTCRVKNSPHGLQN